MQFGTVSTLPSASPVAERLPKDSGATWYLVVAGVLAVLGAMVEFGRRRYPHAIRRTVPNQSRRVIRPVVEAEFDAPARTAEFDPSDWTYDPVRYRDTETAQLTVVAGPPRHLR